MERLIAITAVKAALEGMVGGMKAAPQRRSTCPCCGMPMGETKARRLPLPVNRYPNPGGTRLFPDPNRRDKRPNTWSNFGGFGFPARRRGTFYSSHIGSVKQARAPVNPAFAPLQAQLRQILAGSPGYVSQPPAREARQTGRSLVRGGGSGIEPTPPLSDVAVGLAAPTALNWARTENREQLRTMLGRKPTPEERRAGMQVRRQLAREAGQPFVAINPDNPNPYELQLPGGGWEVPYPSLPSYKRPTTSKLRYPYTGDTRQTNRVIRRTLEENEEDTSRENVADERRIWQSYVRYEDPNHPIQPNAQIRNPRIVDWFEKEPAYYPPRALPAAVDPRQPERYNRTLPPNKQMTQEQMDAIRRAYYTRYPDLVPLEGQPGYEAWRKQGLRGR